MPNTALPTNVAPGTTGRIAQTNVVHAEVNELSRATGLRDITSLLVNGWTATSVYIEITRDWVHFYWRGLDGSAATSNAFLVFGTGGLPNNFIPIGSAYSSAGHFGSNLSDGPYRFNVSGVNMQVTQSSDRRALGAYWQTTSWRRTSTTWPSTLPGTAV